MKISQTEIFMHILTKGNVKHVNKENAETTILLLNTFMSNEATSSMHLMSFGNLF